MERLGSSGNLMSLGALDFGLIVDASVVMVENFVRRLEQHVDRSHAARLPLFRDAANEVAMPVVFGVGIIIAVYLPIFTLQGLEGRMFTPMAFTVCAAIFGSLLLALTCVPAAASFMLTNVRESPARWLETLKAAYARGLDWALDHRFAVIGTGLALLVMALGSVPFLGTEFMPKLD